MLVTLRIPFGGDDTLSAIHAGETGSYEGQKGRPIILPSIPKVLAFPADPQWRKGHIYEEGVAWLLGQQPGLGPKTAPTAL
jgi:hypothetical protein